MKFSSTRPGTISEYWRNKDDEVACVISIDNGSIALRSDRVIEYPSVLFKLLVAVLYEPRTTG